jgi:hypothetical protein
MYEVLHVVTYVTNETRTEGLLNHLSAACALGLFLIQVTFH